jgi:hypothetical protein
VSIELIPDFFMSSSGFMGTTSAEPTMSTELIPDLAVVREGLGSSEVRAMILLRFSTSFALSSEI